MAALRAGGVQAGGGAQLVGRHAGDRARRPPGCARAAAMNCRPLVEALAALGDERLVDQALGDRRRAPSR